MPAQMQAEAETPRVEPGVSLELLRSANQSFARFFAHFAGAPVQGTEEEVVAMCELEQTLHAVGRVLKNNLQASQDDELRNEIARYRDNLVRLRQELFAMQNSAVRCRERLSGRGEHLHAARAWCAATRSTR